MFTERAIAAAESHNLRGKLFQLFDQSGVATSKDYDFKGNLVRGERRLAHAYNQTLVWSAAVLLDAPIYSSRIRYDALNRPIQLVVPHSDQPGTKINILQPTYNAANLLEQVHAWLNRNAEPAGMLFPATADLNAVSGIDYDAKGQRLRIGYGNGVTTTYVYDPLNFRLIHLQSAARRRLDAGPVLHLRPCWQYHAHSGQRTAAHLL